jgi:hypothetical protein
VHEARHLTGVHRAAEQRVRALIWSFYADLKAYRTEPTARRGSELRAQFDRIFQCCTGFVTPTAVPGRDIRKRIGRRRYGGIDQLPTLFS